jgi:hypothetical protein
MGMARHGSLAHVNGEVLPGPGHQGSDTHLVVETRPTQRARLRALNPDGLPR